MGLTRRQSQLDPWSTSYSGLQLQFVAEYEQVLNGIYESQKGGSVISIVRNAMLSIIMKMDARRTVLEAVRYTKSKLRSFIWRR
jgi:ribosome-interacting GTPase 1